MPDSFNARILRCIIVFVAGIEVEIPKRGKDRAEFSLLPWMPLGARLPGRVAIHVYYYQSLRLNIRHITILTYV